MHAVDRIYPDTGPPELAALDRKTRAAHAPDPAFAATAGLATAANSGAKAVKRRGASSKSGVTAARGGDDDDGDDGDDGDDDDDDGPGGLGRGVLPSGFRVNLTFRHAPELCGREGEERFYHFASATRGFLAAQRRGGTDAAREMAQKEKQRAAEKREARRAGRREALAAAALAKSAAAEAESPAHL
jgi:hypothetical protein